MLEERAPVALLFERISPLCGTSFDFKSDGQLLAELYDNINAACSTFVPFFCTLFDSDRSVREVLDGSVWVVNSQNELNIDSCANLLKNPGQPSRVVFFAACTEPFVSSEVYQQRIREGLQFIR